MIKIYVDPGHGGSDSGAVGVDNTREDEVTLSVAKFLREELEWHGFYVMMSRTEDVAKKRMDRVAEANEWGADQVCSLHCNASDNPSANGTEVFVCALGGEAEKIGNKVLTQLVNTLKTTNRELKTAGFDIIKYTNAPAILCEFAFLTNAKDESKIDDLAEQKAVASAICKAYCQHYGKTYKGDYKMYKDDAKISKWAKNAVYNVKKEGIMVGDADGSFRPKDNLTREEAAVIVAKLLERTSK